MMKLKWKKFKFKAFLRQNFFALVSGVAVGTSYIPFPPWAVLFAWAPLWSDVLFEKLNPREAFRRAWISQFVLSLIGFYWVAFVSHEFGDMPWIVAFVLLLLFASTVHLYFPLALALSLRLQSLLKLRDGATLVVFAVLTALGEIYWPSLFSWHLGYTLLWANSPVAQLADVMGFQGLSFILLLANAAFSYGILQTRRHRQLDRKTDSKFWAPALLALLAFVGLHFVGQSRVGEWQNPSDRLRILQVQANVSNVDKMLAERGLGAMAEILQKFSSLTREGLRANPDTDLVIWPEAALPQELNAELLRAPGVAGQFGQFVQSINVPLLTGGFASRRFFDGKKVNIQYFNAMFLYDQSLSPGDSPYRKTHLLAFGEYIPYADKLPFLEALNVNGGSFTPGEGPRVLHAHVANTVVNIGAQICYDSLYPEYSRALSKMGADILVNITNDSWFGPNSEPKQHMLMTMARAIETRRPLVRATNTGITTAILADGSWLQRSPIGEEWTGRFDVLYKKQAPQTFFTLYGAWLPLVLLLFLVLVAVFGHEKRPVQADRHRNPSSE